MWSSLTVLPLHIKCVKKCKRRVSGLNRCFGATETMKEEHGILILIWFCKEQIMKVWVGPNSLWMESIDNYNILYSLMIALLLLL
jgi:hypothetical protein